MVSEQGETPHGKEGYVPKGQDSAGRCRWHLHGAQARRPLHRLSSARRGRQKEQKSRANARDRGSAGQC